MGESRGIFGVGIIGSGFMGQTYAKTVQAMVRGVRLAGVAEGSRAPGLAEQYGIRHFVSYRDLVENAEVDLVCIATPHALHAEHEGE
jgi:predicted dehydrogenase